MKYAALLLITVINCVLLGFASLFAVGGDGSSYGVVTVLGVGLLWIGVSTAFAFWLYRKGRQGVGTVAALITLPAGFMAATVLFFVFQTVDTLLPNSSAFNEMCKTAGAKFVQAPRSRVSSLAYDWAEGEDAPPAFNRFSVSRTGATSGVAYLKPTYPAGIDFVEMRCCETGRPDREKPYIRLAATKLDSSYSELKADALVFYKKRRITEQPGLVQFDLTVTDRRDGQTLATLRYFFHGQKRRACGTTSTRLMDEHAFVMKAIGAQ